MSDLAIKHRFVSQIADEDDTSLVRPSDWNANLTANGSLIGVVAFTGNSTTPFRTIVISGTSNQVSVSNGDGSGNITLSLPQDIHSGASPTFAGLTLSNATASRVAVLDANKTLASSAVTLAEIGFISGVTSGVQAQLDGKQPSLTGASNITIYGLILNGVTASRVLTSDANKSISSSNVTLTELSYLENATSPLQTQLNAKQPTITSSTNLTVGNLTVAGQANNSIACLDSTGKLANVTLGPNLTYNTTTRTLDGAGGGGGTPGGSNGQLQFNTNGAFAGAAKFYYHPSADQASVGVNATTSTERVRVQGATTYIANATSPTVNVDYGQNTGYPTGGYQHGLKVYAYKTVFGERIYSATPATATVTDNSSNITIAAPGDGSISANYTTMDGYTANGTSWDFRVYARKSTPQGDVYTASPLTLSLTDNGGAYTVANATLPDANISYTAGGGYTATGATQSYAIYAYYDSPLGRVYSTGSITDSVTDDNGDYTCDAASSASGTINYGSGSYTANGDTIDYRITAYWTSPEGNVYNGAPPVATVTDDASTSAYNVDVSWSAPGVASGYIVERQINGGGYNDYRDVGGTSINDDGTGWTAGPPTVTPTSRDKLYNVDVTWTAAGGSVSGYRVIRNSTDYQDVGTNSLTDNNTGWSAGTTSTPTSIPYFYYVELSWDAVGDALDYTVQRQQNGGGYTHHRITANTSLTDDSTGWTASAGTVTPGSLPDLYKVTYEWTAASGAEGYRLLNKNTYRTRDYDYYQDVGSNTTSLVDVDDQTWVAGSTVTPSSYYDVSVLGEGPVKTRFLIATGLSSTSLVYADESGQLRSASGVSYDSGNSTLYVGSLSVGNTLSAFDYTGTTLSLTTYGSFYSGAVFCGSSGNVQGLQSRASGSTYLAGFGSTAVNDGVGSDHRAVATGRTGALQLGGTEVNLSDHTTATEVPIRPRSASKKGLIIKLKSSQTANAFEVQLNNGTPVLCVDKNGGIIPPSMADSSAANGTIYYSTTAGKLVYKSSNGTVNNLY